MIPKEWSFVQYFLSWYDDKVMQKDTYLILHNIRSAENVGAIFRTADAAGVKKIYLTGYTPAPIDKFGRVSSKITKTALGAEASVAWDQIKDVAKVINKLKAEKIKIVAVEQDESAIDYRLYKSVRPAAFVFGNEVEGINNHILAECDQVIEIPMRGSKESLNVSVTAGIILFQNLGRPTS